MTTARGQCLPRPHPHTRAAPAPDVIEETSGRTRASPGRRLPTGTGDGGRGRRPHRGTRSDVGGGCACRPPPSVRGDEGKPSRPPAPPPRSMGFDFPVTWDSRAGPTQSVPCLRVRGLVAVSTEVVGGSRLAACRAGCWGLRRVRSPLFRRHNQPWASMFLPEPWPWASVVRQTRGSRGRPCVVAAVSQPRTPVRRGT